MPRNDTTPKPSLELILYRIDEVGKKLDATGSDTNKRLDFIARRLDEIPEKYATKKELEEKLEPVHRDLSSINSNITKIVWMIITAVLGAILTLALRGKVELP